MIKLVFSLLKANIMGLYNFLLTSDKNMFFQYFVESLSNDNIFYTKIFHLVLALYTRRIGLNKPFLVIPN